MTFKNEAQFEQALIDSLTQKGWESEILKNKTQDDLLANWAKILFDNNRTVDRLNNVPLSDGEMSQIIEQITKLRTPLKLNGFINVGSVSIKRDNIADSLHYGKEISLKIFNRHEIAAGQNRYQIVQQPRFNRSAPLAHDRRGDLMLLINGMPVFHLELKNSGVPLSQAYRQIEKYSRESVFTGIFALIQIFVAMTPEETVYFANPGTDGRFNTDYYFHWADFNNEPINAWKEIVKSFLSIPMAHQVIGSYTVADNADGVLKVMRSYQYYAARALSDCVAKTNWLDHSQLGGYIWHTTGSGKTLTSFKSAQLIANSKDADKVIFLMDRIELGLQSLKAYQSFSEDTEAVQATDDTNELITKLKSNNVADTLIVSSIQKMSNIKEEEAGLNAADLELMRSKKIVFILDEAHRSTFGDMLIDIKAAFPNALFFGFTGTPIQQENKRKLSTTASIFGNELHRYSIADGIRDKNVLGFDPYRVATFKDRDLREQVALRKAASKNVDEVMLDPKKKEIYYHYLDNSLVKMAGSYGIDNQYIKGIEDDIPTAQYQQSSHQNKVVEDILENWTILSQGNKFHALFATSSINEAIEYYRLLKKTQPDLKISALFDPNTDNTNDDAFKQKGLLEIMEDYNNQYQQKFDLGSHAQFKKDIASRLAHKEQYKLIERTKDQQLNLLIVVDQMLTGFDSKWINTLYLDKILKNEGIIQAFSRTNRLFGHDKPFGTVKYYRQPHTMQKNIEAAIKLYSGDKPLGLFVDNLERNLEQINYFFKEISHVFSASGSLDFNVLPTETEACGQFVKLFKSLNEHLEAATIQGFTWDKSSYTFKHEDKEPTVLNLQFKEQDYLILALRYKELSRGGNEGGGATCGGAIVFDIDGHLTQIDTGKIDTDYMNSSFNKYLKKLQDNDSKIVLDEALDELHKTFASLKTAEQKYAYLFLGDVERGDIKVDEGKTLRDYITQYQSKAESAQITALVENFGLDELKLRQLLNAPINADNIDEFGRFTALIETVDKDKALLYFEKTENQSIKKFKVNIKVNTLLRDFILSSGVDLA